MSAPSPLRAFVKLLVLDLDASVAFYEALGFSRVAADGSVVHLRWQEAGDVLLVGVPRGVSFEGRRGWGVLVGFTSSTDVEALAERARALSAPVQGPEVQPWHTKDVIVTDPDGYRLNFVQQA
ncbi:MAG: VOC family protein [Myxococcaceae bacterium]|jgi:lactoylglutathione lyase|nr:VOC family protein [Myxococcaceae bacterium]MCA3010916.1 VOC family protein [Myxococcaceae bacterium]